MPINWKAHSISISKRWNDKTAEVPSPEGSQGENTVPSESGTRYFLHAFFAIHFLLQIANAGIQHWETPLYFAYIVLLHGPCLLFNVWVAQGFQEVVAKKCFQLKETTFDAVLSPMGGLTMHHTTTVGQDVKVSLMLPLAYALLCFFWIALYAIFDAAAFDKTIANGVDFDELDNIWGILANVAAQAMYVNIYLVALHFVVPVFPLSGASFFAACLAWQGLGVRATALIMDFFGTLLSVLLLVVGGQQTFFDDANGIGVFVLFNALILSALCIKRRCVDPLEENDLVCRPCYSEKEEMTGEVEATESSPDGTDSSGRAAEGGDDEGEMQDLELV